jgi:hypothetical protein
MATNGTRVEWQKYLRIRPGEKKNAGTRNKQMGLRHTNTFLAFSLSMFANQWDCSTLQKNEATAVHFKKRMDYTCSLHADDFRFGICICQQLSFYSATCKTQSNSSFY